MKIVLQPAIYEEYIKKSRFIGIIHPCQSEQQALTEIKRLHELHPTATHIVYAYRIQHPDNFVCRFNDAGEPSGTAGKPIFQHLEGKQIINAMLAIVRYFGGIKLGAGGLTRAYSGIAKQTLDQTVLTDYIEYSEINMTLAYSQLQALEYQLKKLDGEIMQQDFSDKINLTVKLPKSNIALLAGFSY